VLDADIRDFFGAIDHGWLMRFVEHRIADKRILRLIRQWLAAGVMENGEWAQSESGTPQGATVSPLLANIYLHYVLDLWAQQWRKRRARGDVVITRYVDDFVMGFQHRRDAERFLTELRERLRRFGLELHPEKTRLIEFGRFAIEDRQQRNEGKPESFSFLGFRHICSKSRLGRFRVTRRTDPRRMRAKLSEVKAELKWRRHHPIHEQGAWLRNVVRGFYAYHAVPTNRQALEAFRTQVGRHWWKALRRRSQMDQTSWVETTKRMDRWLPRPRILHEWPERRFEVTHPR
jgi:group II intron reverse transcriptase/maturase